MRILGKWANVMGERGGSYNFLKQKREKRKLDQSKCKGLWEKAAEENGRAMSSYGNTQVMCYNLGMDYWGSCVNKIIQGKNIEKSRNVNLHFLFIGCKQSKV